MKILQIAPAYYPAISIGGPIYSCLTFSELILENHDLTTLTTQLGLENNYKNSIIYNKEINLSNKHTLIYKKYYGYPHFTFAFSIIPWLFKNLNKYDLIVFQGVWNFPFIATSIIANFYKKKYIVFPHGQLYNETFNLRSSRIKKVFYFLFIKSMLLNASKIIFTTIDEEKQVTDYLKIKLNPFIIPNIVKKTDFIPNSASGHFRKKYSISSNCKILLHFGRITKKKGLEFTIYAFNNLIKNGHNVILIIAGGDEEGYKKDLIYLIQKLNISKYIIFEGLIDRTTSKLLLADTDIFILPSYSENFGIAIVEAMLCSVPVIISDRVGIANDIKNANAGIVLDFNKIDNLLPQAIENLLLNDSLRLEIANRGKNFAIDNYDIEIVRKRFQELINYFNIN